MLQPRIIPVLLLQKGGLVKTVRFKNPAYIGDPMNAVKIFNEKGADELLLIDLDASQNAKPMDSNRLKEIASEAFMPVSYGGGVRSLKDVETVIKCGVEKIVVNTTAVSDSAFVSNAAKEFGSSTLSVSADYKRSWLNGVYVTRHRSTLRTKHSPLEFCRLMEESGAGEIILHNTDYDGTMKGYDVDLLKRVCEKTKIPVVACGGAASYNDLAKAIACGASGAAAGSLFVFSGPHQGVLINYPTEEWRQINTTREPTPLPRFQ